jgi:hypothetical protein
MIWRISIGQKFGFPLFNMGVCCRIARREIKEGPKGSTVAVENVFEMTPSLGGSEACPSTSRPVRRRMMMIPLRCG